MGVAVREKGSNLSQPDEREPQTTLGDLLTDLMAYALIFCQASGGERPPGLVQARGKITELLGEQEKRVKAGEANWESYREARFAVLAWIDELILNQPWASRAQWQHLMLTYYGTLNAGEEFFDHLEKLPSEAKDVREIYYLCLRLGFQGKYAVAGKPDDLRQLRHTLYRHVTGPSDEIRQRYHRLFPEAYEKPPAEERRARPAAWQLWCGLAILVPTMLFLTYWFILGRETNRLIASMERQVVPAPPVLDWGRSLVEELRRKGIEARETPLGVVITLPGLLFEVNRAELGPGSEGKIADVALVVKRHAPTRVVSVEGHASREPGTLDERNFRLSEDRAKRVAETLVSNGLGSEKVTAKGLGSSKPVAPNDSEEGRRKNRRVELIVEKE